MNDERLPGQGPTCEHICAQQAVALLMGPLRPSAHTCSHGHRYVLDDLFPPQKAKR